MADGRFSSYIIGLAGPFLKPVPCKELVQLLNNSGQMNWTLEQVYISMTDLCCEENGNVDGDSEAKVNLADITRLIDHVYISKAETASCE